MKITKMNVTAITIPLKEKFQVSFRFVTDTNVIILELETDEGITGVGEVVPLPRFNGQTVESITAAIDRYMRPYIIGENNNDIPKGGKVRKPLSPLKPEYVEDIKNALISGGLINS